MGNSTGNNSKKVFCETLIRAERARKGTDTAWDEWCRLHAGGSAWGVPGGSAFRRPRKSADRQTWRAQDWGRPSQVAGYADGGSLLASRVTREAARLGQTLLCTAAFFSSLGRAGAGGHDTCDVLIPGGCCPASVGTNGFPEVGSQWCHQAWMTWAQEYPLGGYSLLTTWECPPVEPESWDWGRQRGGTPRVSGASVRSLGCLPA